MTRATKGGGATPATRALAAAGVAFTQHAYAHDPRAPSYGLEAAAALGVDPARVCKTLLARTDLAAHHGLVVAIIPVTARLDLKALAAAVGAKRAVMAQAAEAERSTGFVVGGISPFGQKRVLVTVLATPALTHPSIYVSGGRRGLDLELAPADLVRVTGARAADIAR